MKRKRKTKKEKIIASLRRKIKYQSLQGRETSPSLTPPPTVAKPEKEIPPPKPRPSPSSLPPKSQPKTITIMVEPIKKDLRKTFFLSLFAIAIELVIYWGRR